MQYNQTVTMLELIGFLRSEEKISLYCIYGEGDSDDITLEDKCVIDEYAQISDDDEEIFPERILNKKLEFWFTDELLENVVFNALKQKPSASNDELLDALKYYNQRDSFMMLSV